MLRAVRYAMRFLICLLLLSVFPLLRAEESFLKPNDVIALVGGEEMVVASELGYLETLLQGVYPSHKLKFRSLAWEGDTVFEQRRDLNYPPLEAQLEKVGATVVIAQFGQMESLGGREKLPEFIAAYEKLIGRLQGAGKRRVMLVPPCGYSYSSERTASAVRNPQNFAAYVEAIEKLASRTGAQVLPPPMDFFPASASVFRDGVHLTVESHRLFASILSAELGFGSPNPPAHLQNVIALPGTEELTKAVAAKNRLWYHYSRPQNWAFLAGDRTNQPSSRDHIDRNKRWFPEELEKFVPLIEAKEKAIWELAAKLKN